MKPKTSSKLYIALAIIAIFILAAGIIYLNQHASQKIKPAAITGISEIKYGSVQNGKLVGAKYVVQATLSPTDDEILLRLKGTELKFGDYTIQPQQNLRIKMKSQNPYATAGMNTYPFSYYQPSSGQVMQISALIGEASWKYHTPYVVNIYSDGQNIPTALVSSKFVDEIGQSWLPVSNNGISAQQTSIAFLGPSDLPRPNLIVVATAPQYAGITTVAPDYRPITYIFDKANLDSKSQYFYNQFGSRTLTWLVNPAMALWTGYDTFSYTGGICGRFSSAYTNDFCRLDSYASWKGLYKEVSRPDFDLSYDPGTNTLKANGIQYSAIINLEIPSEIVDSLAVLRGVGSPEILTVDFPSVVRNDNGNKQMVATVRNNGDNDGFNIQPISKSGKLIFTPSSYTNYPINKDGQAQFQFQISVAGKETAEVKANEDISIEVRALHNPEKVTKTVTINIDYSPLPPGQPTVKPTDASTVPGAIKKGTVLPWYQQWYVWLLAALGLVTTYFVYDGHKKDTKKRRNNGTKPR